MLKEYTLFGVRDKVQTAIERLKSFEPPEGYYLAFSGGKDSICIYQLAKMSGVKFDAHYHITGIDHPTLVRFIIDRYPEIERHHPSKTMWQLIPEHSMPPTRLVRYCCEELKEHGGSGRLVVTGIRAAESSKRKRRKMTEVCFKDHSRRYLHPIIDWTDDDVWIFIKSHNLPYPALYDQGYKRLGCIGCPMNPAAAADLNAYPRFKALYLRAFDKMLKRRQERGLKTAWKSAEDVMKWWINKKVKAIPENEMLFGFGETAEDNDE